MFVNETNQIVSNLATALIKANNSIKELCKLDDNGEWDGSMEQIAITNQLYSIMETLLGETITAKATSEWECNHSTMAEGMDINNAYLERFIQTPFVLDYGEDIVDFPTDKTVNHR
jgi:hypothetical protein